MKRIFLLTMLSLLSVLLFAISWDIETDIGIEIELDDVTNDYAFMNQIMGKDYEYVEVKIYNENPDINFCFFSSWSKALFIDRKNETFRHKDIYLEFVSRLSWKQAIRYQDIIDKLNTIDLGYRESATILLAFPKDFDFFKAKVFKIQFGYGLYIEYYKKGRKIIIIDDYDKLK